MMFGIDGGVGGLEGDWLFYYLVFIDFELLFIAEDGKLFFF